MTRTLIYAALLAAFCTGAQCEDEDHPPPCDTGSEDCRCFDDGACHVGLVCDRGICVAPPRTCVIGQERTCMCASGDIGRQFCLDGYNYVPCECPDAG